MCVLMLAGCGFAAQANETFESMDTCMQINLYGSAGTAAVVRAEIERLDALLSATDEHSDVYRLNRDGEAPVDPDTCELLEKTQETCRALDNDLNIFVYPLVEAWGFIDRNYTIPAPKTIETLLSAAQNARLARTETNFLKIEGQDARLDLGAVAKGYAADRAIAVMADNGVFSGILNLGGTVAAVGKKPSGELWRVGICDPDSQSSYFASVAVSDKIVATSGSYERYFERGGKRYCHIIDPKTGYPVDNGTVSVTVISDSGFQSDALSTALFVKGLDGAVQYWRKNGGFEFILLDENNRLYLTEGIEAAFRMADYYDYEVYVIKASG